MFREFLKSKGGNVALLAGLLAVPLMGSAGIAMDYAYIYQIESQLQNATDSAALTTAKELGLANSDPDALKTVASNYVFSNLGEMATAQDTTIDVEPADDRSEIKVTVSHVWEPLFLHYIDSTALPLVATSTARLAGKGTMCMLGLDDNLKKTIFLKKNAKLEAPGCGVYSNSTNPEAIKVDDNAKLEAGVICSAGGFRGAKHSSFEPKPITDCPKVGDPLADRPTPQVGACDHTKFKIDSGTHTLYPGTYCKGLKIKGTAKAYLKPGIYVITGDKLEVTDNATLEGEYVGFYLNGHKAKLEFKKQTTISLTAPKEGILAGILMFEDRHASNKLQKHQITSDNAGMLLGTIYLPNGTLKIDSQAPIADEAAYTAIIARAIELDEGPTLHLNSDYEATDVPVPDGLIKDKPYLAK